MTSEIDERLVMGSASVSLRRLGIGDVVVGVRTLARSRLAALRLLAADRVRARFGTIDARASSSLELRELQRLVVADALVDDRAAPYFTVEDLRDFDDATVDRLYRLWSLTASEAPGDYAEPVAEIEQARAVHACALVAYYGSKSARELTDRQIMEWMRHFRGPTDDDRL